MIWVLVAALSLAGVGLLFLATRKIPLDPRDRKAMDERDALERALTTKLPRWR